MPSTRYCPVTQGKPFYDELTKFISSDFVVGMELVSDDCIKKWRQLLGPTNCQIARVEAPQSIRAQFGTEGVRNACHGSDSRRQSLTQRRRPSAS
jgi:nucleoside-diphosphate kinase